MPDNDFVPTHRVIREIPPFGIGQPVRLTNRRPYTFPAGDHREGGREVVDVEASHGTCGTFFAEVFEPLPAMAEPAVSEPELEDAMLGGRVIGEGLAARLAAGASAFGAVLDSSTTSEASATELLALVSRMRRFVPDDDPVAVWADAALGRSPEPDPEPWEAEDPADAAENAPAGPVGAMSGLSAFDHIECAEQHRLGDLTGRQLREVHVHATLAVAKLLAAGLGASGL